MLAERMAENHGAANAALWASRMARGAFLFYYRQWRRDGRCTAREHDSDLEHGMANAALESWLTR